MKFLNALKLVYTLFFIVSSFYFLQAQKVIFDASTDSLAIIQDEFLLNTKHQVLYNHKGFIVFDKKSNNKNDILLTFDIRKKKTLIYNKIETSPIWIIRENTIEWRKNRADILVFNIKRENGFTSFYNAFNDSLIAYVDHEAISEKELSLTLFYIWNTLNLEQIFEEALTVSYTQDSDLPDGILGSMKPVFGDPLNVWYWDGKYLFPAFDRDERYVWEYDGKTIKPIWNSRIENEWSWDGDELKPYWGGHPKNNWRWDNGILRQVFENDYKNEYEIVDNIVRKRFGSFGDNEWEIEGEMPLPVLTLVLLGIVYR